jgi:glycerol-3-phosphate dehydrogenase
MTLRYSTDIVIFGGGIAGLWLLATLRERGYHAVLFEKTATGTGQTLASQGIIHGGLKYALGGALSGASQAIATMPARWRSMLQFSASETREPGDLDLSAVQVLSDHYYMWSDGSFRSRLKNFLGSKSLRGRVTPVAGDDYPEFFANAPGDRGSLYRLPDFVVDTPSLLAALSSAHREAIYHTGDYEVDFTRAADGTVACCHLQNDEHSLAISAQRFIFAAGEGNQQLLDLAGIDTIRSQVRPLHMVYLSKADLPAVYLHCIGSDFSLTPQLTITSHTRLDGTPVWYLGGELAEAGVNRDAAEQIAAAQEQLGRLFPWLDVQGAEWQSFRINRAEPAHSSNARPDDAFLGNVANTHVVWPTKLTLTPALADRAIALLQESQVEPRQSAEEALPLPLAEPAPARWS